ncbi:MAG TPA: Ig-like domain-containing protein [Thermoanaerobaculia bacterium]|nr:Ig-like domain-containing protein [Thermoanaerobaculia bacterium]
MNLRFLLLAAALPALAAAQPGAPVVSSQAPNLAVRKPTDLASKGMIGAVGDTVPLKATLTSKADGKPLAGKSISFKVAGKDAGNATTGPTGEAKLDYKVPNDPPPGPHPMEARFAGDSEWGSSSVSANFGVFKASTKITFNAPPTGVNEGETANVSGKLVRITDQAGIHGREISMTVNGKTAGKVTTSNGGFTLSYPVPKNFPPKATVEAQFEGDVLYAATAATTAFDVKNPVKPGFLLWEGAKGKIGETVTLKARLTEAPVGIGKGISGIVVRFWMDRGPRWAAPHVPQINLCQGTTDSSGGASCSVKLNATALPYTAYAHADVDTQVWNVTKVSDPIIDIDKAAVHLALSGPSTAHIGQSISIKVRVTRTTDGGPVKNASIHLSPAAAKTTDDNGDATFTLPVPSGGTGPKPFKATYAGNDNYHPGEGSITINVTPATN